MLSSLEIYVAVASLSQAKRFFSFPLYFVDVIDARLTRFDDLKASDLVVASSSLLFFLSCAVLCWNLAKEAANGVGKICCCKKERKRMTASEWAKAALRFWSPGYCLLLKAHQPLLVSSSSFMWWLVRLQPLGIVERKAASNNKQSAIIFVWLTSPSRPHSPHIYLCSFGFISRRRLIFYKLYFCQLGAVCVQSPWEVDLAVPGATSCLYKLLIDSINVCLALPCPDVPSYWQLHVLCVYVI